MTTIATIDALVDAARRGVPYVPLVPMSGDDKGFYQREMGIIQRLKTMKDEKAKLRKLRNASRKAQRLLGTKPPGEAE